jgi:hypothetical protein
MATKSISVWCVAVLVAGGMFWLGGASSALGWELGGPGEMMPGSPTALEPPPVTSTVTVPPAPAVPVAASPQASAGTPSTSSPPSATVSPGLTPTSSLAPAPGLTPVPTSPANNQPLATGEMKDTPVCGNEECVDFCGTALCGPPGQIWLRAEYLTWWTNGTRLPPLVTTSSQNDRGILGAPTTVVIYGDSTVGSDMRSGVHATVGMWLDRCHIWSFEADYLTLGGNSNSFQRTSAGDTLYARPFFNTETGAQDSELVSAIGLVQGTVQVESRSDFQSAGEWLGYNLCCCDHCCSCDACPACDSCDPCGGGCGQVCNPCSCSGCRTDLLVGIRYYRLNDYTSITENLEMTSGTSTVPAGTKFGIQDNFRARNDFLGSEIGLRTQLYRGRWSLEVLTKIAMGNNHQSIGIVGQTKRTLPTGESDTFYTGILAGPYNSGYYSRDTLTLIPQLSLQLGYQVSCHCRAYIGYNVLYWGNVARAADQIDLNVDPRNFPPATPGGLPFPQFTGRTSDFWAQGMSLGTEFRF